MSLRLGILLPAVGLTALVACSGQIETSPTSPIAVSPTPSATEEEPASPTASPTATRAPTPTATAIPPTPSLSQATPSATGTPAAPTPTPTATALPDRDGDGAPDVDDCAPDDASVHPGATEVCTPEGDAADEDCDGAVDEGLDTDGDGVPDCLDAEVCNGDDDDGDGSVDEGAADLDGDGLCDDVDPDRDGDRVANAVDPAPDDPSVNTDPTGFFTMPGAGTLHLLAPEAAYVDLTVDVGAGPEPVDGGPWALTANEGADIPLPAGFVRLGSTTPVVGFFTDASGSGDRLVRAVGAAGEAAGNVLYVWAESFVSVVGASGAPGTVRVERSVDGVWTLVSSVSIAEGSGTSLAVGAPGIYRVRSSGGTVTAYGWRLDGTFSGMTYLAGAAGLTGTTLRFSKPTSAPELKVGVLSPTSPANVTVSRSGVPVQSLTLSQAGEVGWATLTDSSAYAFTSNAPILAWVEGSGGKTGVDTTVRDAGLAPDVNGATWGREFVLGASHLAGAPNLTDLSVQAWDDETLVTTSVWTEAGWAPAGSMALDRGDGWAAFEDLAADARVRIEATQPVTVTRSQGPAQFGGTVWVGRAFTSIARGEGRSCDPSGALDHCELGLSCIEAVCAAQE